MASAPIREYWAPFRGRDDVLSFAPFILSALWLGNVRYQSVDVAGIIAVFEEHGHELARLDWGDLVAMAVEAHTRYNRDPRLWRARAAGFLIPPCIGTPKLDPVAELAVFDESLAALVVRRESRQTERQS